MNFHTCWCWCCSFKKKNADAATVLPYLQRKQSCCSEKAELLQWERRDAVRISSVLYTHRMRCQVNAPIAAPQTDETENTRTEKLSERKLQELVSWSRQGLGHCLILTHVLNHHIPAAGLSHSLFLNSDTNNLQLPTADCPTMAPYNHDLKPNITTCTLSSAGLGRCH
jgi:hypothetical protein